MQITPDYTKQLSDIARALTKPTLPTWLVALLSSIVGAISTLIVQRVARRLESFDDREKMRRVVYSEIIHLFFMAQSVAGMNEPILPGALGIARAQLAADLRFHGEQYVQEHLDVHISELPAIRHVFREFHRILEEPKRLADACRDAQWMVGFYLSKGDLQAKYFKEYGQPGQGERLVDLAGTLYRKSIEQAEARQKELPDLGSNTGF